MSRWVYIVFAVLVVSVTTMINLGSLSDHSGGSRSWGSGSSGGSWSSGGGGHK